MTSQRTSGATPALHSTASLYRLLAGVGSLSVLAAVVATTGLAFFLLGVAHWHPLAAEIALALPFGITATLLVRHERRKAREAQREFAIATERNLALKAASEARQLTHHIVDESLIGMAFYRGDSGECVLTNQALARIVGGELARVKELRFRNVRSLLESGLVEVAERVLCTGKPERATRHVTSTFGREIDIDCLFSRVTLENSEHLLLMVDDVTERVSADRKVREEAARSQRYLDTVQTIVVSLDQRGRITMINRKGAEVLGWRPHELKGRRWFEICLPQSSRPRQWPFNFHRMVNGEIEPFKSFDHPVITRDGAVRLIEWRAAPVLDSQGAILGSVSSGIDVTDKRATEALNRRNHARLVALLELQQGEHASEQDLLKKALVAGLNQTESSFGCAMCRSAAGAAAEFVSVSCDAEHEATGMTCAAMLGVNNVWQRVIESQKPWICNDTPSMADMPRVPSSVSHVLRRFLVVPIIHDKNVVALIGVANKSTSYDESDIVQLTLLMESVWKLIEQRRAERALDTANQKLQVAIAQAYDLAQSAEAASRAKSAFLANMSHELRTPMNAVLGFAELMQHDENLTPQQRDNLATIRRSGAALLELINDVLELSKIEAGHQTVRIASVHLRKLAAEIRKLFEPQAQEKGLQFELDVHADVPGVILADEGKLRQILVNLIGNALKFTPQGSVSAAFARSDTSLVMSVVDTGVGIESEALEAIFSAFTQGSAGRSSHQGTGLGLTLCRMLARLHGGDVTVQTELGRGSTFNVTIPLREASEVERLASVQPTGMPKRPMLAPGQRCRVLVAEDSQPIRNLLEQILEPAGFELYWADDGLAAVEAYQRVQPEFVLMDMRMPRMDGFEAARRIRELEGDRRATIVGLSGDAFAEDCQRARNSGCDEYIAKPFHIDELFELLGRHQGLRFVATSAAQPQPPEAVPNSSRLRNFPPEWWALLDEATALGDIRRIRGLADDIQARAPNLAVQLRTLASRFDLRGIDNLIHQGSGQWIL